MSGPRGPIGDAGPGCCWAVRQWKGNAMLIKQKPTTRANEDRRIPPPQNCNYRGPETIVSPAVQTLQQEQGPKTIGIGAPDCWGSELGDACCRHRER
mgnify:CR=1 FL=1